MRKTYIQPQTLKEELGVRFSVLQSASPESNVNNNPQSDIWGNAPGRKVTILYV